VLTGAPLSAALCRYAAGARARVAAAALNRVGSPEVRAI
jgi:hypothetical protein